MHFMIAVTLQWKSNADNDHFGCPQIIVSALTTSTTNQPTNGNKISLLVSLAGKCQKMGKTHWNKMRDSPIRVTTHQRTHFNNQM